MSYVKRIPGCPTCGHVPFSPTGRYPWYDHEAGDRIECDNTQCPLPAYIVGGSPECIVKRWKTPTERDWELSEKRLAFFGALRNALKAALSASEETK